MASRKQKRQDEPGAKPQQAAQAPVAEAIALGAAAGGLVLGTMQAQGALPDGQDATPLVRPDETTRSDSHVEIAQAAPPADHVAPVDVDAVATQPVAAQPEPAEAPVTAPADPVTPEAMEGAIVANSLPAPVQSQLVSELSEQMTATLVKVIGNAEPGLSPADLGQSIAGDVIASAQQIVAKLDIGSLLAETQNLGDSILAQMGAPGVVAEALGATSGIADRGLSEVTDLPASILSDARMVIAELPSSLLGNDGPDGSGGLLSELFYADGASDSLDIPVLSEVASSVVSEIGGGVSGLLGVSYIDTPDQQGGQGLNALSLM